MPQPTNYDVQLPDVPGFMSGLVDTVAKNREQRTLSEIGGYAAAGDLSGAAARAFQAGKLDTGAAFAGMDQKQQEKVAAILGNAARTADTPEKWAQFVDTVGKRFPHVNLAPYRDFSARDSVLAETGDWYKDQELALSRDRLALDREKLAAANADTAGGYFGTLAYGQDANGNWVVLRPAKGKANMDAAPIPEGVTVVGPQDMAAAKAAGAQEGKNAVNLPGALAAGDRLTRGIDDLLSDPGLSRITGPIQGGLLSWMPNFTGAANRAQSRLDQIQGGTFLQAFDDLRGGGQITEAEGSKATAALNRLSKTSMGDADYVKALREFKVEVAKLMEVAKAKAGVKAGPPGGGGTSVVVNGYKIEAE